MNMYDSMKFPDFVQKDWPKLAYPDGNKRGARTVLCHSQAEFDAAMGEKPASAGEAESAKDKALREAAELGVEVKGNWGATRIQQAIDEFVAQAAGGAAPPAPTSNEDDEN